MTGSITRRDALLRTAALASAGLLPAVPAIAVPPSKSARSGDIDKSLHAAVAGEAIPGVVAMAADHQSLLYEGAVGLRGAGGEARMTADTVFRIASMVKLLTSVAAMQLVERGRLKLDEPAGNIDPVLAAPHILTGFDSSGAPQLREAREYLTLRNLLTHTSGLSYPLWDANVLRYIQFARSRKDKGLPRMPLMFEPGAKWAYGGGIDRVGRMVEIASGQGIDRYFRDNITGPLGMNDTGFIITERQRARQARLHRRGADGRLMAQPFEKLETPTSFSGGGGIYSTAPDYLRLLQALLNGGSLDGAKILKAETVSQMALNQIGNIEAGIMRTTNPALSNDVDFFPGTRLRWGLGHMINADAVSGGRRAGSLTWAGLYNTYYWIDPSTRVAGVIMMQILPFADRPALKVYREFEQAVCRAVRRG
jgi:CubicO group peptidase (beta-lactamase class C family)